MSAKLPVAALPAALSRNASVSAAADVINVQIIAPPDAASSVAGEATAAGEISADIMAQL